MPPLDAPTTAATSVSLPARPASPARTAARTASLARAAGDSLVGRLPGLALASAIGLAAYEAGRLVPEVGGPVIAVVCGIVVATLAGHRPAWVPGIRFGTHQLLKAAIVLLGFGLSLGTVWATARASGVVMLGTLATGLGAAALVGRLVGVRGHRQALVGVGTAICGASAIAAVAGVLEPEDDDVAYAITVIFVFNVAAVLTFPVLARVMHLGGHGFGLWAGTAVNDMSSVVAATSVFGHGSLHTGVVVKLARTLMILPVAGALFAHRRHREAPEARRSGARALLRSFPLFLVAFLAASLARTTGLVGGSLAAGAGKASLVVITVALAAVGLSARPDHIRRAGLRPLAFGAILWVVVAGTSLALQALVGG